MVPTGVGTVTEGLVGIEDDSSSDESIAELDGGWPASEIGDRRAV